jgi:hypothetical protein
MKIKIVACKDSLLWYYDHLGKEFEVVKQDKNIYWVCEPDTTFRLLNWVDKKDAQLLVDYQ